MFSSVVESAFVKFFQGEGPQTPFPAFILLYRVLVTFQAHVGSFSRDGVKAITWPEDEVKKNDIKKWKRKLRNFVKALILNSSWAYVRSSKSTPSPVRFCDLPLQGVATYFSMASTLHHRLK